MLRALTRTRGSPTSWSRIVGAAALTGGVTTTAYVQATTTSEQRQGLRRQVYFWYNLFPIVADYYWHFGSKSPRRWLMNQSEESKADHDERLSHLHAKHAPAALQIMLDLKGLYIKLGQVLSVTALPIPNVYRQHFRTLQSDVPGYEQFQVVQKVLRQEFQTNDLDAIFSYIDPIPSGAASIGQAHYAKLRPQDGQDGPEQDVIVKVQYPDAQVTVPADIRCVGDLLQVCIWCGVLDESAARISFDDFSTQFRTELDYLAEARHLQETYASSCDDGIPNNPYQRHGVIVPRIFPQFCTEKAITMSYLKGPKLEQEARQQLEALGIDTSKGIKSLVGNAGLVETKDSGDDAKDVGQIDPNDQKPLKSWKAGLARRLGRWMGVNTALWAFRRTRGVVLWSNAAVAETVGLAAPILPTSWKSWCDEQLLAYRQHQRLAVTKDWMEALLDVHGFQIFHQGLFNADCHPGNILVLENDKLGLIDYGQCKRLNTEERRRVAKLVLSVARKESDEEIANAFRGLGVQTKNNSTEFLAEMARLMFGRFETQHLSHSFHRRLHTMDRITYFPKELAMVYRTCLLLRGLAVSLQMNPSAAEHWAEHAQVALERRDAEEASSDRKQLQRMTTRVSFGGLKHRTRTIKTS